MSQIIILITVIHLNYCSFIFTINLKNSFIFSSLQSDFEEQRQKTEFVDDNMEKMLNHNKTWFILIVLGFGWLTYKSLFAQKK